MENLRNRRIQLLSATYLNIGYLYTGVMNGWSSAVIPKLEDPNQTPLPHTITLTQGSWVGSLVPLGFLCGSVVVGKISNSCGRKLCAIIGAFIVSVGSIILLLANSLALFLVGRFICGVGMGIIGVNSIFYIGEISSANIRGILLTSTGVFYAIGILVINALGLTSYTVISYAVLLLALLHCLSCFYIEESPIFYLIKGQEDKTIKALERLGRKNEILELTNMDEYSRFNKKQDWKWHELLTVKCNRKSFMIGLPLIIFQLCSGSLLTSSFTTSIFQLAGSSIKPAIASIITSSTMVLGSLIVPKFIETNGRRTLMMISSFGCFLTYAFLGIYFYLQNCCSHLIEFLTWAPLALLMYSFLSSSIA